MRAPLVAIVLVALATLATASTPIAGNVPTDIMPAAQDPAPTCRIIAAPLHLFVVVQHDSDQDTLREALWSAGVPAGSTLRTYWDAQAGRALERATHDATASGTAPLIAPATNVDAWTATLLPLKC